MTIKNVYSFIIIFLIFGIGATYYIDNKLDSSFNKTDNKLDSSFNKLENMFDKLSYKIDSGIEKTKEDIDKIILDSVNERK